MPTLKNSADRILFSIFSLECWPQKNTLPLRAIPPTICALWCSGGTASLRSAPHSTMHSVMKNDHRSRKTKRMLPFLFVIVLCAHSAQGNELVRQDAERLLSYRHVATIGIGLGLAGLAHTWDGNLKEHMPGQAPFATTVRYTNIYGSSYFNLPASVGLWGVGALGRYPQLRETGATLLRTMLWTQAVVGPVKWSVRRRRPDHSNRLSFPSGHTANAFAIARLMHRSHGPRIGVPLYALGIFVAAGRVEDNRHYFSDVIMGAALGLVVGNSVHIKGVSRRVSLTPQMIGSQPQLVLRVRF